MCILYASADEAIVGDLVGSLESYIVDENEGNEVTLYLSTKKGDELQEFSFFVSNRLKSERIFLETQLYQYRTVQISLVALTNIVLKRALKIPSRCTIKALYSISRSKELEQAQCLFP